MKMDQSKAYDIVEWPFLLKIMGKMSFSPQWQDWIEQCISSSSFKILLNGKQAKKFEATRGLRQGDPFSPYLFLLCVESLSAAINKATEDSQFLGINVRWRSRTITHLPFADDCYVFGIATQENANTIKELLDSFQSTSGQLVNYEKFDLFFYSQTPQTIRQRLS